MTIAHQSPENRFDTLRRQGKSKWCKHIAVRSEVPRHKEKLILVFEVVRANRKTLGRVAQSAVTDYTYAVVIEAPRPINAKCIVTLDESDFAKFPVPAHSLMALIGLLAQLPSERTGAVFSWRWKVKGHVIGKDVSIPRYLYLSFQALSHLPSLLPPRRKIQSVFGWEGKFNAAQTGSRTHP